MIADGKQIISLNSFKVPAFLLEDEVKIHDGSIRFNNSPSSIKRSCVDNNLLTLLFGRFTTTQK